MQKQLNPLINKPPTLNPYWRSIIMSAKRLQWDLYFESFRSRKKLKKVLDSHKGKKAVILCNGPSLLKTDFDQLENVYTFGLNKINLLFDKTEFRPSSIVAVNRFVLEQNREFFNTTDIDLFLDSIASTDKLINSRRNIIFLHSGYNMHGFARDCSISISQGHTVTFAAMQLAFHLGFKEVALVGCDHNFADKGPENMTVVAGEKDLNHFDPNYFANGVQWQLPDLFESEVAYHRALKMYEAYERKLINCTVGGKLEILPRMDLKDFLS